MAPPKAPEENADEGDADLDGGEELAGILRQQERTRSPSIAGFRHLLQPHAPRGNNRHLRQRKKSVQNNEPDDDGQLEPHAHNGRQHNHPSAPRNRQDIRISLSV